MMIDLTIRFTGIDTNIEAFVGKVVKFEPMLDDNSCTNLVCHDDGKIFYQGQVISFQSTISLDENEVVLIFPKEGLIQRFYRPQSNSNTILITERCDQCCMMCSQPPKNKDYLHWNLYKQALLLVEDGAVVGISGGEPTLEKHYLLDLFEFAKTKRPDITFHVLTNAQHFVENDILQLSEIAENILWGVPIYADTPELHDKIVGKPGAFDALMRGFSILLKSNSRVELRTVLLQENMGRLPSLAKFVGKYFQWPEVWSLMQLEPIGFAKIQWESKFADTSLFFDFVKEAIVVSQACGIQIQLFNFPTCTVPEMFQKFCVNSISDWKQKYLNSCDNCSAKGSCCGFFEWYDESHGYKNLRAISS